MNYSMRAAAFDAWAHERTSCKAAGDLRQRLLDAVIGGTADRLHILDVGCGPGRDLAAFGQAGHEVVGLEPCVAFARIAQENSPHARVLLHDIVANPAPQLGGPYDAIFCLASLFHVPRAEVSLALSRLWSALRPGGGLLTTFPDSTVAASFRGPDGRWITAIPLKDHSALVEANGFEIVEAYSGCNIYNGNWGVVISRRC